MKLLKKIRFILPFILIFPVYAYSQKYEEYNPISLRKVYPPYPKTVSEYDGHFKINVPYRPPFTDSCTLGFSMRTSVDGGAWTSWERYYTSSYVARGLAVGEHTFDIRKLCFQDADENGEAYYYTQLKVNVLEVAVVTPDYKVVSIIYAPPGTKGGKSSSVTYFKGSELGSKTTAENSFKSDFGLTASTGFGVGFIDWDVKVNATQSTTNTSLDSLTITKKEGHELTINGPGIDGIDHNRDKIVLWLRPKLNFVMNRDGTEGLWGVDTDKKMTLLHVYVGDLLDPSRMNVQTSTFLLSAGITEQHYPDILSTHPLLNNETLDPDRFIHEARLNFTPPYDPDDESPMTYNFTQENTRALTNTSSTKVDYSVNTTVEASADLLFLYQSKITANGMWSWSDIDTRSDTDITIEKASISLTNPSFGYTGPPIIDIYYDVIYKTFAFVGVDSVAVSQGLQGSLESETGSSVGGKEVILRADGKVYRTFTDKKGNYNFPYDFSGVDKALLEIDGTTMKSSLSEIEGAKVTID